MFIDTRSIDSASRIHATLCIVGAGPAGITLALEMERMGIDTVLLESGGLGPDDGTRDLYRGSDVGLPYDFADGCRSRYLGGSSNCWGGWCRPLDPWDFTRRSWLPHSGWPLDAEEMAPWYLRTHSVLRLGPQNFDPAWWERAVGRRDVRRLPLVSGRVRDTVSQFSPPVRFGKLYRHDLERARHVRVMLHANAVNLDTGLPVQGIREVQGATLNGRRFTVAARAYVLACGGIENARLLLASNRIDPSG
ncbi:MAG TPA: FAD-dependent oxidoreductase, partial [Telluria sp.]|nr:FAD-dependent oxidoreductase [Telluria sp.]